MLGELALAERDAQGAADQRGFDEVAGVAGIVGALARGGRVGVDPGEAVEIAIADCAGELLAQGLRGRGLQADFELRLR